MGNIIKHKLNKKADFRVGIKSRGCFIGKSSTFKGCINVLADINYANRPQRSYVYLQIGLWKTCCTLCLPQLVNFIAFQSIIIAKG